MTSISELSALHEEILRLDEKAESAKQAYLAELELANQARAKLMTMMESAQLTNFRSSHGQVVLSQKFSVRLPADPESWDSLWGYLKERGHYETLRTINHQRLNGWYKAELDAAKERGDIDLQIPGLAEPSFMPILSFRK